MSSCAHVFLTTAKQVISRRKKNENVCGMSKNEKCTCKACKSIVFHCQICKFVTFLLPSSSWLRKLPIVLCVYERFLVHGWKRYVNDDRVRVDGDKNMRLLAFAFTIVFVWTGPELQFLSQMHLLLESTTNTVLAKLCANEEGLLIFCSTGFANLFVDLLDGGWRVEVSPLFLNHEVKCNFLFFLAYPRTQKGYRSVCK